MVSLKQIAHCIQLDDPDHFSILRHFYGYAQILPAPLSLLTQIRRLQGSHLHINCIRVGCDQFSYSDHAEIDRAVHFLRENYSQVNIGIGRVSHYQISTSDANGYENIESNYEACKLTGEWSVPNDGCDIFFVLTYAGKPIGYSPRPGSCNKDSLRMSGCVVSLEGNGNITGIVLAHELAHYIGGLHHSDDVENLMYEDLFHGEHLNSEQGEKMRDHCFIKSGC